MATQSNTPEVNTVLWLVTDETAEPYEHKLDGKCDCKTCESKKSHVIVPQ